MALAADIADGGDAELTALLDGNADCAGDGVGEGGFIARGLGHQGFEPVYEVAAGEFGGMEIAEFEMSVRVDQAREEDGIGKIDCRCAVGRNLIDSSDGDDAAVFDFDGGVPERAVGQWGRSRRRAICRVGVPAHRERYRWASTPSLHLLRMIWARRA